MALVVVTNQAGIGRGYYTEEDFRALTDWMLARFAEKGIAIAGIEHCPHHPTKGLGAYRRDCRRRKPEPGMILDAAAALGLYTGRSVMIGDKATDMQAALAAGVATRILLTDSQEEASAAPPGTRVLPDGALREAAEIVAALGG